MKKELLQTYIDKKLITERKHFDNDQICIYNYTNLCQIERAWDEVTLQCRGLIIDWGIVPEGKIIARPFDKFFNYGEQDIELPAEQPYVMEKYDGSLGILYWIDDVPYIATRGSFESDQAKWATKWFRNNAVFDDFNKQITYLFEIIYPENRIVVDYKGMKGLILIGMRDTKSKLHHVPMVQTPYILPSTMHNEFQEIDEVINTQRDNAEGFVLWFPSTDLMIKIKHEEYKRLHKIITGVNAKAVWEILKDGRSVDELLDRVPDEFYKWVKETAAGLQREYNNIFHECVQKFTEVRGMHTKKDQALHIKDFKHKNVVFALIDDKDHAEIIWRKVKPKANEPFKQEI